MPHAEIASENGTIALELDHAGNGPRLKVAAQPAGRAVFLDPLELEALTWAPAEIFQARPSEPSAAAGGDGGGPQPQRPAFAAEIANEFARVTVALEHGEGGPRLRIAADRLHRTLHLDPGQLEALTAVEPSTLAALMATPFGPEADDAPGAGPTRAQG